MKTALPIIHPQADIGTGTEFGISTYSQAMMCPKSVYLKRRMEAEGIADVGASSEALKVGSYFHALAANYHGQEKSPYWGHPVEVSDAASDEEKVEAERLMQAYARVIGPEDLGRVLCVEQELPGDEMEQTRARHAGLWPLTGQVDMCVHIDEMQSDALTDSLGIDIWAGTWLVDYKTTKRNTQARKLGILDGMQFVGYPLLWNACKPEQPVEGTLIVHIYRTKVVGIDFDIIPYPTKHREQVFRQWLSQAQGIVKDNLWYANASACFSGFTPCHWYMKGICNRLSDTLGQDPKKPLSTT